MSGIYRHIDRLGRRYKLSEMTDKHLDATIKLIERKAWEGITIHSGGGGPDAEDMWYEQYTIYGAEALNKMHYWNYVREQELRKMTRGELLPKQE